MTQNLQSLLTKVGIKTSSIPGNLCIEGITSDSRLINKGDLFVGLPGEKVDGGFFWRQAIAAGAVAALISAHSAKLTTPDQEDSVIVVPDSVAYWMGEIASVFWNQPSLKMDLIGVTGTNGKTTTTHLIEHLSSNCGSQSALFGTLYNRWPEYSEVAIHTTAFGDVLQKKLAQAVASRASVGAMEVSSHALDQKRVAGCRFSGAIFTNLTHDHLDYHQSMEAYFEAKAQLFKLSYLEEEEISAVVNIDDKWGELLSKKLKNNCWRASLDPNVIHSLQPELFISDVHATTSGFEGLLHSPFGNGSFTSSLIGRFNLMNVLQAVGILLLKGFALDELLSCIPSFPGVPGRMERIKVEGDLPSVLVDYAHTPDGLKNALLALRSLASGKLLCVFGCGGNRDQRKRPEMGLIASEIADTVILTSDNPRNEDPQKIIGDIYEGTSTNGEVIVEIDRAIAIEMAIAKALPGDIVLIAGKGHEDYQILRDETIKFDDRKLATEVLCSMLGS